MLNKNPNTESNTTIKQLNKQKKIIIAVFLSLIVFVILYFGISAIDWTKIFSTKDPGSYNEEIYFYDKSLSENLDTDEVYMGLDRTVNLLIESSGISETITDDDVTSYNEAVNLLYSMIEYMIIGNDEAYNGCFSPTYFSKAEPQGKFTKQKLYDITIIEVSQSDKKDENGKSYIEYYYKLDYRIRHNNGSLRNDVGSDGIKTQHIILSDKTGVVLVDMIYTLNYINK